MALNSVDDLVNGLSNTSQNVVLATTTSGAFTPEAGSFVSMWYSLGVPGGGTNLPALFNSGGPYTASSGTVGALTITGATNQNYLAEISLADTEGGSYVIADRVWMARLGTAAGAGTYTITTPGSLPARITDNGKGCQIYIEGMSALTIAANATNGFTVNYLDSNNIARSSTIANAARTTASHFLRLVPHAAGAYGVSQITSVVRVGTWTAGILAVVIMKPLISIPSVTNAGITLDWAQTRLFKFHNDACISMYRYSSSSNVTSMWGDLTIIDK